MEHQSSGRMRMVWLVVIAGILAGGAIGAKAEIVVSKPTNLGPVINDAYDMQECDFSHDGLELYFCSYRPDGHGGGDIWVAKRATINSAWQEPVNLGPNVNSSGHELEPSISGNGLELYLGCWDDYILRVCTRPSKDAPWSTPAKMGPPVCSDVPATEIGSNDAWTPEISADGLSLYFTSTRVGGYGDFDIWVAKRATIHDDWGEPSNLGPKVNSGARDCSPSISTDGLTLIFKSRGGGSLWATTRKSTDDDWGPAVQLALGPNEGWLHGPALSPDGSTLYFEAYAAWGGYGKGDFWQVNFVPIVDFNADGTVDITDLVCLIECWGKNDSSVDTGPLPWGDGKVDAVDLEVLMSQWGQEVNDPTLVAHWALDETEGTTAHDGAGGNDGIFVGLPQWRPQSGRIGGALELDGTSCVTTRKAAPSPADGPFSILAWVKGGAPGQAVVSQQNSVNWLVADAATGALMTGLSKSVRTGSGLLSQAIITDGNWHRIAFTWDGTNRRLHVDGVLAAEDAQEGLAASSGNLILGAGRTLAPDTFWKGLIDDVRIYNRAVKP